MPQGEELARHLAADGVATMVATLEEDIVLGLLAPGMRLVEDDLMARFDAKRHVVRDALAQLERSGLIERRRNIGALVRSFSRQEVLDLYDMRMLLETQAVQRMCLPTEASALAQLEQLQSAHDSAIAAQDPRQVFRSNQAFHRALFAQCGNPHLAQSIEDFARRTHAIRFGTLLSRQRQLQSQAEHHQMLQALRQGDRTSLVALTQEHLLPPRDQYLQMQAQIDSRVSG